MVSSGYAGFGPKAGGAIREQRDGNTWHHPRQNGTSPGQPGAPVPGLEGPINLVVAIRGVEEAVGVTDWVLRCAGTALEHPNSTRNDAENVLAKLSSWVAPPADRQVLSQIANSMVPGCVVRAIRKLRNETLAAALCCVVLVRASGSSEGASAFLRAGALEEIGGLMDRHPTHGGIQNVCLLALCVLLKDSGAARQAVTLGAVTRVLRALEATNGREVQFNGLSALRLLTDNGRAPRAGLQESAMRAKVAHQNDTTICAVANDVLALVTPRFKEVLCWHWQSGWCKLGPRCTYAHGPSDLRNG